MADKRKNALCDKPYWWRAWYVYNNAINKTQDSAQAFYGRLAFYNFVAVSDFGVCFALVRLTKRIM